jgi:hypothetical protein
MPVNLATWETEVRKKSDSRPASAKKFTRLFLKT